MKKLWAIISLIAIAISSGAIIFNILKKAGLEDIFDFDLNEEIDNEEFSSL
jgi:hypothetical protein